MVLIWKKKNSLYELLANENTDLLSILSEGKPEVEYSKPKTVKDEEPVEPKKSVPTKGLPKTYSIKSAISETNIVEPAIEVPKVQQVEDWGSDSSHEADDSSIEESFYTQEDVSKHWLNYISTSLHDKPRIASLLSNYLPTVDTDLSLKVNLESQLQLDLFHEVKKELVAFLRKKLDNKNLEIKESVISSTESNGKIYTVEDRFKFLSQKNPKLIKLKQQLNLDYD